MRYSAPKRIHCILNESQIHLLFVFRSAEALSNPEHEHYAADKIKERAERVDERQKKNKLEAQAVTDLLQVGTSLDIYIASPPVPILPIVPTCIEKLKFYNASVLYDIKLGYLSKLFLI